MLSRAYRLWTVAPLLLAAESLFAGDPGALVIADKGKTAAVVVVAPKAGPWEKRAAEDLVHFIGLMRGAKPALANTEAAATTVLKE